jgi:hypothetical protein
MLILCERQGPRSPSRWLAPDPATYAYLLGLYLGDGCLGNHGHQLMISLDARYPGIVEAAEEAITVTVPGITTRRYRPKQNSVRVIATSSTWPAAFPQHGPGRNTSGPSNSFHGNGRSRDAFLELLRGLIHSDGCRCMNRFKTKLPSGRVAAYEYPRYFFSNLSEDIRRIFCEHCELLGIRWTQSNARNISISHRKSVALIDEFIGPKW